VSSVLNIIQISAPIAKEGPKGNAVAAGSQSSS